MYVLTNPVYGEDYNEGYVFFSYTMNSLVSSGIALFQELDNVCGVQLSHCGIISGPEMCVESTTPVVMESNFIEKYVNEPHTVVFLRKPLHWNAGGAKAMIAEVRKDLGMKYSYTGIAGSALLLLLTWGFRFLPFLRYYKNPLNRDDEMFC